MEPTVEPSQAGPVDSSGTSDGPESQLLVEDFQKLSDMVQKVSDERDAVRDQLLRTMADFQNFRKRQQEQQKLFQLLATEEIVRELLPVLDNFERTLASIDAGATLESVSGGIRAVERQMRSVLEAHGVVRIASVGAPFDPALHEALGTEASDEHEDETVVKELEPGYKMGDRVLRPARVRVAKS